MKRKFSTEYKQEAVRLITEQGLSLTQVAQDLGIGLSTITKWVHAHRAGQTSVTEFGESEVAELKRLRKEVQTLRMERDILKKATVYFAKDSQ